MKTLTTKSALLLSCCLILLSACNNGGNGIPTSTVSTTSTPATLRAIPMSELTAVVTVDGTTTSYFGRNYPDNNWIIYLNIEAAREYPIKIEWFANDDILLMMQEGTLFSRNSEEVATPLLTSVSEGSGFDYDCDRVSNLDEVINGTDPGRADGPICLLESAPVNVVAPADIVAPKTPSQTLTPVVQQNYNLFESTALSGRVTRFSQPINVQTTNPNRRAAYRISLIDVNTAISISIDLLDDPSFGRFARFFNNNVESNVTLIPATGTDSNCSNRRCSLPFDWQEDHWYELVFEEDSTDSTQLGVSVLDTETQAVTQLGTLLIPANTVWTRPNVVLFYHEQITAADCAGGLLPATLHFRAGIANNAVNMKEPIATPPTSCVVWGSGASTSTITGDTLGDIYSLTLGER